MPSEPLRQDFSDDYLRHAKEAAQAVRSKAASYDAWDMAGDVLAFIAELVRVRQEAESYKSRADIAEREFVEQRRLVHSWSGRCGSEQVRAERAEREAAAWERRYYNLANEKNTRLDDERTEQEAAEQ